MKNYIRCLLIIFCLYFLACNSNKQNSIRIGAILPLSGEMAKYGKTSEAALRASLKTINERREKNGVPSIDLIIEDDKLEPKSGVGALKKLIEVDKVPAIIGAMASSITLAMAPIAEASKVVLVSPGSSNPKVSTAGDYVFRTVISDTYEGKVAASIYDKDFLGKRLAILYINNDYGVGLKEVFKENVKPVEPILELGYNQGEINFRTILAKIKSKKQEVVYLIGYNEMIQIFKQANEIGLKVGWIGTNQLNDQTLINQIGNSANGVIFPAWEFDLQNIKDKNGEFYAEYQKLSGGLDLDIFAANAVDALSVLDYAMKGSEVTGEEVKNELYKIRQFSGLTGSFSFDRNGDVNKELDIKKIQNSEIVAVK